MELFISIFLDMATPVAVGFGFLAASFKTFMFVLPRL